LGCNPKPDWVVTANPVEVHNTILSANIENQSGEKKMKKKVFELESAFS
jgi:hypothetical protein